jgi:hypothetical protein
MFMQVPLAGIFLFFGAHTLMYPLAPRRREHDAQKGRPSTTASPFIVRFTPTSGSSTSCCSPLTWRRPGCRCCSAIASGLA